MICYYIYIFRLHLPTPSLEQPMDPYTKRAIGWALVLIGALLGGVGLLLVSITITPVTVGVAGAGAVLCIGGALPLASTDRVQPR
jgi:hypothetical protein